MSGYENFERKPKHECCREGYPLNLISLESIICKGSNCSPVELLGLKREHVLGEEKALTFICLEMSEKQSCAKPSLHLQQLWGSWWREGPLEAFLDVYYFKTTVRRSGFATWRCLAVTLQMVFIRKMRDTIFAKHFNSRYRTVLLSQKQCSVAYNHETKGFFSHLPSPTRLPGATMKYGTKYFQSWGRLWASLLWAWPGKTCNLNSPHSSKGSEQPRSKFLRGIKVVTLGRKLLTSLRSDAETLFCLLNTFWFTNICINQLICFKPNLLSLKLTL